MKILLTNDDGINARGIYELYHSLKDIHEVTVVAPISQKSGAGHSITLNEPLRINKFYKDGVFFGYAINGTPADCIKIGLCQFLRSFIPIVREKKLPDYVTLNINVPNLPYDLIKGVKITYQSYRQFEDRFIERRDPFNSEIPLTGNIIG